MISPLDRKLLRDLGDRCVRSFHEAFRAAADAGEDVPRDAGVGAPDDGPGSHSGGDVSMDYTGVGTGGGVAESGAGGHTTGPATSTGGSEEFASGPPARGDNQARRSTRVPGTTHGADTPGRSAGGSPDGAYPTDDAMGATKSDAVDPLVGGPAGVEARDDDDDDDDNTDDTEDMDENDRT